MVRICLEAASLASLPGWAGAPELVAAQAVYGAYKRFAGRSLRSTCMPVQSLNFHAMPPRSNKPMSPAVILLLALLAGFGAGSSFAAPSPGRAETPPGQSSSRWTGDGDAYLVARVDRPPYRSADRHVRRPVHTSAYGAWWYGYPAYGFGLGLGLGYGAGWSVSAGFPAYYGAWPFYPVEPYVYASPRFAPLVVTEDLVFVQQPPAVAPDPARPAAGFWYYCAEPAGYYPYVQRCSQPWTAVQPRAARPGP